jgi:hypothetical protein
MNRRSVLLASALLFAASLPCRGGDDEAEKRLKAGDRDPEFLLRVNKAVSKGIEFLITQQKEDGSFKINYSEEFAGAPTAFALLALLKSGVPRSDAVIEKGFTFLRRTPMKKVYSVSFTIMALEARWSKQEVEKRQEGHTRAVAARPKIPGNELDWMRELVRFLLENMAYEQDIRDESGNIVGKKNCWRYPSAVEVGDHSNSQYALLALRAAKNCGIQIPPGIWADILDHFVKTQEKDGPVVRRIRMIEDRKHGYVSYKPLTGVADRARGWCYSTYVPPTEGGSPETSTTGSMTSVGVASLLIAMDCLMGNSKLNSKRQAEARRAIQDGLAWLTHHFTVETNPGHPHGSWPYYYLYGMERAAVLAGARNLGEHDWYREGAEWFMKHQAKDGAWRHKSVGVVPGTGFALLFLVKATIPGRVKITR